MHKISYIFLSVIIFFVFIGNCSAATPLAPTGGDGKINEMDARVVLYAYLNAGENLYVERLYAEDTTDIEITDPEGNVYSFSPGTAPFLNSSLNSSKSGIWIIKFPNALTYTRINVDIHVIKGSTPVYGRVWTKTIIFDQSSTLMDLTLYFVAPDGHAFQIIYDKYLGFISSIASVSEIFTDRSMLYEFNKCRTYYISVRLGTTYSGVDASVCAKLAPENNIFIDPPNPDLPKKALLPNGEEDFVYPTLAPPVINSLTYKNTTFKSQGGIFTVDLDNYQSDYFIWIDVNNNGSFDDAVDVKLVGRYSESNQVTWNGKDNKGNIVPLSQDLNFKVEIRSFTSVFFAMGDIEALGGVQITKLSAYKSADIGDRTIYWDDTLLPFASGNTCVRNNPSLTPLYNFDGVDSTGGVHGWERFEILSCSYLEGTPNATNADHTSSYGDGNWINNFASDDITVTKLFSASGIDISKTVVDENKDEVLQAEENFTYTITINNRTTKTLENLFIQDDLTDILPYIESVPEDIPITISGGSNFSGSHATLADLINGFSVDIGVGETLTITYTLKSTDKILELNGSPLVNKAQVGDAQISVSISPEGNPQTGSKIIFFPFILISLLSGYLYSTLKNKNILHKI